MSASLAPKLDTGPKYARTVNEVDLDQNKPIDHVNRLRKTQQHTIPSVNAVQMSALPTLHQDFEQLSFDAVNNGPERTKAFTLINFQLNQHQVAKLCGKVDTGAQSNILPLRTYRKMYPQNLDSSGYPTSTEPSSTTLTAYNGTRIPQHGTLTMQCQFENSPWEQCLFM